MRIPRDSFANFVSELSQDTQANVDKCRENLLVSRTSREGLNVFKKNLQIFQQNTREPVARLSYDVRASHGILSPRKFGKFTMRQFRDTRTNFVRQSRDSLEKTCEQLATIC